MKARAESIDSIVIVKTQPAYNAAYNRVIKGNRLAQTDYFSNVPYPDLPGAFFSLDLSSFQDYNPSLPKRSLVVYSVIVADKKVMIPDLNQDSNFSNDPVLEYEIAKTKREQGNSGVTLTEVNYERFIDGVTRSRSLWLKILPFEPTTFKASNNAELLQVYFSSELIRQGQFDIGSRSYKIVLSDPLAFEPDYSNPKIDLIDPLSDSLYDFDPSIVIGETFSLLPMAVVITSISLFGDSITINIKNRKGALIEGIREGDALSDRAYSVLQTALPNWSIEGSKYLLIDFWGSWCSPCLKSIPELKKVVQEFEGTNKLTTLSVAYEQTADVDRVKELISSLKMNWDHTIETIPFRQGNTSLVKTFRIEKFPTTLIVYKGRIVYRSFGATSIGHLREILQTNKN